MIFPNLSQFCFRELKILKRTHLSVLDFSFRWLLLRPVFLRQDWVDFFGVGDKYSGFFRFFSWLGVCTSSSVFASILPISGSRRNLRTLSCSPFCDFVRTEIPGVTAFTPQRKKTSYRLSKSQFSTMISSNSPLLHSMKGSFFKGLLFSLLSSLVPSKWASAWKGHVWTFRLSENQQRPQLPRNHGRKINLRRTTLKRLTSDRSVWIWNRREQSFYLKQNSRCDLG